MGQNLGWYLYYKGVYYDVGTKVKLRTKWNEEVTTTFLGGRNYEGVGQYSFYSLEAPETYIIEIIEPVYYQPLKRDSFKACTCGWLSDDATVIGFIWYIFIMLFGIIFKARILIWIVATLIFFSWKSQK